MGGGGRTPLLRPPGEAGELPRIEFDRPLVPTAEIVADPFPANPLGVPNGLAGVEGLARLGENAMPSVLNPPDVSSLVPVTDVEGLATLSAPGGFWSRLWGGITRLFGFSPSFNAMEEGAALMSARRAIALDETSGQEPTFSLTDPNPFVRVRNKLEIDMPGSESLDAFLGRLGARSPESNRAEARAILSLLTDPAASSLPLVTSLRSEVSAEVLGSGQGYRNRYQIADAVRTVLARHGLDAAALEAGSPAGDRASIESVFQNLSLHLMPDDVPVYRTIARNVVSRGEGSLSMAANLDGMTYWGVGSEGIAVTRTYVDEGHMLVTTTVGELRRLGVLTTDDIAIAGNAVELFHQPLETGGWRSVPVSAVRSSPNP